MDTINNILDKLCKEFIVEKTRSKFKYKITTPFVYPNGEFVEFLIEIIDENTIILDDLSNTYKYFDLNFFEPTSTAQDKISDICKSFQITNSDSFSKIISLNSKYYIHDIYDFINSLIRLSDIIYYKHSQKDKNSFIFDLVSFIKDGVEAKYKYFSAGIKPYDNDDEFKVDIALSNDNEKWVLVNGIRNQNQATEKNLSIVHYKYELHVEMESILVFENLETFSKGKKINRLLNYADTTIPTFDKMGQSRLEEVVNKRLRG